MTAIDVQSKIERIDYFVDSKTNRRIGYVVTEVEPIDRKDDEEVHQVESGNNTSSEKIDRNTLGEDEPGE